MIDTVVIPVGGLGSRMKSVSEKIPKPLLEVNDKTIIQHILDSLSRFSISRVVFTISFQSTQFLKYISSIKNNYSFSISTFHEPFPLGEAGALWHLRDIRHYSIC